MSDEVEQHESFGMIGFSRVSSSHGVSFFGSSIRSNHFIHLRIKRGSRRRDLAHYWYHGEENLIEIRLSPNQFAELLTTLNVGDGVPCTIERVGNQQMAECPAVHQRQLYEDEFRQTMKDVAEKAHDLERQVVDMFFDGERIGKKARLDVKGKLGALVAYIDDKMPWVQKQFNEAMDKTVVEAKGEVEAFVNHKIHSLGIEALNAEVMAALEAPLNSEPLQLYSAEE